MTFRLERKTFRFYKYGKLRSSKKIDKKSIYGLAIVVNKIVDELSICM